MPELREGEMIPLAIDHSPKDIGTPAVREWGQKIEWGLIEIGRKLDGEVAWGVLDIALPDAVSVLHVAARQELGPGKRYEIRQKVPGNYGRTKGVAWYRAETFDDAESWGSVPEKPTYDEHVGAYLIGQFVT